MQVCHTNQRLSEAYAFASFQTFTASHFSQAVTDSDTAGTSECTFTLIFPEEFHARQSQHTMHSRGVDLVRIEVISDDKDNIAATALRLRELVGGSGAVITSGGIGPTHDDVTYEALAAAYGTRLALHQLAKLSCSIHSIVTSVLYGGAAGLQPLLLPAGCDLPVSVISRDACPLASRG